MSSFNATADLLMAHLSTLSDGDTEVCMLDQFGHAALDVICKVTADQPPWIDSISAFIFCSITN